MFTPGLLVVAPLLPGSFRDMRQMVRSTKAGLLPSEPSGPGTPADPWVLKTPSGQSEYTAYRDETADPPALVVHVGKTELRYQLRCLDDLGHMLAAHGTWMPLGSADEQKPAASGTIEAW